MQITSLCVINLSRLISVTYFVSRKRTIRFSYRNIDIHFVDNCVASVADLYRCYLYLIACHQLLILLSASASFYWSRVTIKHAPYVKHQTSGITNVTVIIIAEVHFDILRYR